MLQILALIEATDPLLQAHVFTINGDPDVRGSNFEEPTTHLMLADPVEKEHTKQSSCKSPPVFSTLAGRGDSTGVDL